MPLAFYICAGISALFLIFALSKIASHLFDIHKDLCDIHEEVLRRKRECEQRRQEYELRRGAQPKVDVRFASTPRSSNAWLANIGTVGELAAQYRENIPEPKEPCDHSALRPRDDMGLCAWGGSCDGAAMGVAR